MLSDLEFNRMLAERAAERGRLISERSRAGLGFWRLVGVVALGCLIAHGAWAAAAWIVAELQK